MVDKLCRFCFRKSSRAIGIFTDKGVKLKIAETIRIHFHHEISENECDVLPKFVCTNCWSKVNEFHEFYNRVDAATNDFLKNLVKEEPLPFVEVKCDAIDFTKVEPELLLGTSLPTPFELDDVDARSIENDLNDEEIDNFMDDESNESDSDDAAKSDAIITTTPIQNVNNKRQNFDHLMSQYMNMTCDVCGHPFESMLKAFTHYRNEHGSQEILVKCCEHQLPLDQVKEHIRYHMNPDVFKCEECNKQFMRRKALQRHMIQVHNVQKFECDICSRIYSSRNAIRGHMSSVHMNKRQTFQCEYCQKSFHKKFNMNSHIKNMHKTEDREMICHICGKVYTTKTNLIRHVAEHNGIKQPRVTCTVCGSSLKNTASLRKHMVSHREYGKIFKCPQCPKISPTQNALVRHVKSVHNYTPQKCEICGREFKRAIALKEHIATHTGVDLYTCKYCPRTFKDNANMFKHFKQAHLEQWNADRRPRWERGRMGEES